PLPQPRDSQRNGADPGVPVPEAVPVTVVGALGGTFIASGADLLRDFEFHQRFSQELKPFPEHVLVGLVLAQQLHQRDLEIGHRRRDPLQVVGCASTRRERAGDLFCQPPPGLHGILHPTWDTNDPPARSSHDLSVSAFLSVRIPRKSCRSVYVSRAAGDASKTSSRQRRSRAPSSSGGQVNHLRSRLGPRRTWRTTGSPRVVAGLPLIQGPAGNDPPSNESSTPNSRPKGLEVEDLAGGWKSERDSRLVSGPLLYPRHCQGA